MGFVEGRENIGNTNGAFRLKQPDSIWVASMMAWGPLYIGLVLFLFIQASGTEGLSALNVLAAILVALFPMYFIVTLFTRYTLYEDGIERSLLGRRFFIAWEEVDSISGSEVSNGAVVTSKNGTIRLAWRLVGMDEFARRVVNQLPLEKYAMVISRIESLAGIYDQGRAVNVSDLKVTKDPTKRAVMKYPMVFKFMGLFPYVFVLPVIYHFMTSETSLDSGISNSLIFLLIIVVPTLPILLEFLFTKYTVDDEGIERFSVLRGRRRFYWTGITSISYSNDNHWFIISSSKKKLRLYHSLVGMRDFARIVVTHVPEEKWTEAKRMMLRYAS